MRGQSQRSTGRAPHYPTGRRGWLTALTHAHSHGDPSGEPRRDPAYTTREGIRTVWIALAILGLTTVLQVIIVMISGSVALLADTIHNLGDVLNSIPLLIAFYLARRLATRRYTYGFGRAEDVAGVVIVLSILFSAGFILYESARKLLDPQPMEHLPWVAAAALIGAIGNEGVALFQIRVGRRMGSEAMIADGLHARIDGLTSLAVLIAVVGAALGYPIVDPVVGLLIGLTILAIARDATRRVWYRLMDAVEPEVIERLEQYSAEIPGVDAVQRVRARWVGHYLHAEISLIVDETRAAHSDTVAAVRRLLLTHVRHLAEVTIEVSPAIRGATVEPTGRSGVATILPPQYQDTTRSVSAAPMGSAALIRDEAGEVVWGEMWTGFCELALAGGAPHRGTLLEPVNDADIVADPDRYASVLAELERGITQVTELPVRHSDTPGWIGMECVDEDMALWLLRAIAVENVTVRREGRVLWFPAGPHFRLEREIKNVITVVAKTTHYWREHSAEMAAR